MLHDSLLDTLTKTPLLPGRNLIVPVRHFEEEIEPVVDGNIFPHLFHDSPVCHGENIIVPIQEENASATHRPEDIEEVFVSGVVTTLVIDVKMRDERHQRYDATGRPEGRVYSWAMQRRPCPVFQDMSDTMSRKHGEGDTGGEGKSRDVKGDDIQEYGIDKVEQDNRREEYSPAPSPYFHPTPEADE
jgi:hypothetical protein